MSTRRNVLDPSIDMMGTVPVNNSKNLPVDEAGLLGAQGTTGPTAAANEDISAPALGLQTLTDTGAAFTDAEIGRFITIENSVAGNNGTSLIVSRTATSLTFLAITGGGIEVAPCAATFKTNDAYTIADDINFARTDRKNIKGTAQHYTAVPTYTRPDATGTPVPANLTNIAGKTTDAKPIVRDELQHNIQLRPPINDVDGALLIGDETFTTTKMHFTALDLNSFITISGSTDADGTYRIKTVNANNSVELDGLNSATAEACNWALVAGLKGVLSARNYADATDTTGIPIADAGAFDNTHYDATFVEMISTVTGFHPLTNADLALFGRSFGNIKDPKRTADNEGVRFFVQLLTGLNDGTATNAVLQMLAGRNGSVATLAGGNKQIGGLTGMVAEDVGRFITLYNCGTAGDCGIYQIETVDSATQVTVTRTGNFSADANSGSIKWAVSQEGNLWDFYNGDRYRLDQLDDTAFRTTMVGGITSDAALATAIHNLQLFTGAAPGEQHPVLTNTGAYYIFNNLPSPAMSSLEEIVQAINDQIGNRTYSGTGVLAPHDGETITQSLQRLSDAIGAAGSVRTIERLASGGPGVPKFTNHIAGGVTYVLDGTGNGRRLWVFWRGLLRDPGTVANGDDYEETDTTHITPYTKINAGDHINYFVVG